MGDVSRGGRTIFFVSHNVAAIEQLCHRCVWLHDGKKAFDGPTREATLLYQRTIVSHDQDGRGDYDLARRVNTYLDGRVVIRRVVVRGETGEITNSIRMGDPLFVEITVAGLSSYRGAIVGFRVCSENDRLLADFNTGMCPPKRIGSAKAESESYRLQLAQFPFVQGTYHFGIAVAAKPMGLIDFVEHVGNIVVTEHDVYGTGYRIPTNHSLVLLKGSWEVGAPDSEREVLPPAASALR
jgi:lipopolysaccharide transport system ATP-binding protein